MSAEPGGLPPEVAAAAGQLDDLLQMFAKHPDEDVQEAVIGMLRAVDVLHRGALQRLGDLLDAQSLRDEALADPHVALLFDLYGADGDDDERSRAQAAVAKIRPEVEAHGGRVEIVTAEGGVISIRLVGAADSSSESRAELLRLVEEVLRAELPEFVRMTLSPPPSRTGSAREPTPVVIPLSQVTRRARGSSSQPATGSGGLGRSNAG